MMQMLDRSGIEVVTDRLRASDPDNPRGYYEYEAVKNLREDATWIPEARGKAVKIVSLLLYHLPPTERYRIVFMERDLEEVVHSQEAMLLRLNRNAAPHEEMCESYKTHLKGLENWLAEKTNMSVLRIDYKDLVEQPRVQAQRVSDFLQIALDVDAMASAVDPALYRQRNRNGF